MEIGVCFSWALGLLLRQLQVFSESISALIKQINMSVLIQTNDRIKVA